ncbi:MAG TPA: hypothetical protein VJ770_16435 [Stellaceae bacterium]|nr:hypothetical protein [Stellaceae bacterium]
MNLSASPGTGYRLDIAAATVDAYRAVADNTRLAADLARLPFAVVLVAEIAAGVLGSGPFGWTLAGLAHVVGLVIGTVFVVRWHRFLLLGERTASALFTPPWRVFFGATVRLALLLLAGWLVLLLVALLPPHGITAPLFLIGAIALVLAAVRVSLIFPAAAIDSPLSFRAAWDLLEGNYWRLFAAIILCTLPFSIGRSILARIGGGAAFPIWLVFEAAGLVVAFAGVAVVTALVSETYRRLTGPAPGGLANAAA